MTVTITMTSPHSPWCSPDRCDEAIPGREWNHSSAPLLDLVPWQYDTRVSVRLERDDRPENDTVPGGETTVTVAIGQQLGPDGPWDTTSSSLTLDEAEAYARAVLDAVDQARANRPAD